MLEFSVALWIYSFKLLLESEALGETSLRSDVDMHKNYYNLCNPVEIFC